MNTMEKIAQCTPEERADLHRRVEAMDTTPERKASIHKTIMLIDLAVTGFGERVAQ